MSERATCHLEFGGEVISFAIERTARRKTVAISVGFDGVRVLSPSDLEDKHIIAIVRQKSLWLLRKQAGYQELGRGPVLREFISGETFHYLGRPYRLKVVPDASAVVTRIIARGSSLTAPVLPAAQPLVRRAAVRSALKHWYRDHAKGHFPERARHLAGLLEIKEPKVLVVDQSKRWGSCDKRGQIRLNWRLIMAPVTLIDYVIAHEACHVLEPNHSRKFWRLLETILPDYEKRVRQLDGMGHSFLW
jgi:predicted metal-dependent hydrolase